jgi:hypothetical protein
MATPRHAPRRARPRIPEPVARPARTALQGTPAWLLASWYDAFHPMTKDQFFLTAAVLTLAIGALQTLIENYLGAGLLRQVPPTSAPVVDDRDEPGTVA